MDTDPEFKRSMALLIGKVAAVDLKVTRLSELLVQKGVLDEEEKAIHPLDAEKFIVAEFADLLQGMGLTFGEIEKNNSSSQ